MENLDIWVSVAALLVACAAFIHTVTRTVSTSRLQASQLRSDILTRIVKLNLKLEDSSLFLSQLISLENQINDKDKDDYIEQLSSSLEKNDSNLESLNSFYEKLIELKNPPNNFLIELNHDIDLISLHTLRYQEFLAQWKQSAGEMPVVETNKII